MTDAADNLEQRITDIMAKYPKGATQQNLQEAVPSLTPVQLVGCLNKLLTQNKIDILKRGKMLVYVLKNQTAANIVQGAGIEEKVILEAIERAGNNGIAPKDLKFKCNLPQPQVTKILKSLESKQLIKSVMSMSSSRKKVYMLFGLEPSHAVTGGIFYSGQEFESEFVDVLGDQCYRYLMEAKSAADNLPDPISRKSASLKSSKDICNYLNGLQISKVKLSVQDTEKILESLIYDGKLEKSKALGSSSTSKDKASENFYKVAKPVISSIGLMRMPCGVCPVFHICAPGKEISPSTCVYMKEWLEL